jgi:hypothetical protein
MAQAHATAAKAEKAFYKYIVIQRGIVHLALKKLIYEPYPRQKPPAILQDSLRHPSLLNISSSWPF